MDQGAGFHTYHQAQERMRYQENERLMRGTMRDGTRRWDDVECLNCGSADVDLAEAIPGPLFACQECGHAFDPEDESTWEQVERVWTPDERPRHYVCRYKDVTIVVPQEDGIE